MFQDILNFCNRNNFGCVADLMDGSVQNVLPATMQIIKKDMSREEQLALIADNLKLIENYDRVFESIGRSMDSTAPGAKDAACATVMGYVESSNVPGLAVLINTNASDLERIASALKVLRHLCEERQLPLLRDVETLEKRFTVFETDCIKRENQQLKARLAEYEKQLASKKLTLDTEDDKEEEEEFAQRFDADDVWEAPGEEEELLPQVGSVASLTNALKGPAMLPWPKRGVVAASDAPAKKGAKGADKRRKVVVKAPRKPWAAKGPNDDGDTDDSQSTQYHGIP